MEVDISNYRIPKMKESMDITNSSQPALLPSCISNGNNSGQQLRSSLLESKMKPSRSLSSLQTEGFPMPSCREREVKSEERCFQRNVTPSRYSPVRDKERIIRRSPTNKDECWDALWTHYNYLMDEGLIATCREASGELSWDDEEISPSYNWSFTEFIQQFNLLHDWLHRLQSTAAGVETTENNFDISNAVLEELQKVVCLCKFFNEQAQKLGKRYPDMSDEINRRLNLLNNKWEAVEQAINPHKPQPSEDGVFQEVAYQMKCLRRWLRELENRLHPLTISSTWTLQDLEEKYKDQQALQKEIESQSKYVSSLLKLCDQLGAHREESKPPLLFWDAERVRRVAVNLERRWHSLWLRSLEWQCLIEELIHKYKSGCLPGDPNFELSFSEEPVKKYPRLSGEWDDLSHNEFTMMMDHKTTDEEEISNSGISENLDTELGSIQSQVRDIGIICGIPGESPNTNDKGIMVGTTGITQLKAECGGTVGRFEIIQDVGYSSESSAHLSNDERQEFIRVYNYSPDGQPLVSEYTITGQSQSATCSLTTSRQSDNLRNLKSSPKIFLTPDKYPLVPLKDWQFAAEDEPLEALKSKPAFSLPDSSFYKMTSIDTESIDDGIKNNIVQSSLDRHDIFKIADIPLKSDIKNQNIEDNSSYFHKAFLELENSMNLSLCTLTGENQNLDRSFISAETQCSTPCKKKTSIDSIHNSVLQEENIMSENNNQSSKHLKSPSLKKCSGRTSRVRKWLQTCPSTANESVSSHSENGEVPKGPITDSSCDASGEYTTNESDCEQSSSSEDKNNSLVLTRSYAGSVETVIPFVAEDKSVRQDQANTGETSFHVVLRTKKRRSRDRPWSVTELHHVPGRLGVSQLSTSDGALDKMVHPHLKSKSSSLIISTSRTKQSSSPSREQITVKPRRHRSRTSLLNSTYRSDSGSDGLSPGLRLNKCVPFIRHSGSDSATQSTPIRRRRSSSSLHTSAISDGGTCTSRHSFHRSSHSSQSSMSGSSCGRNKRSPAISDTYQGISSQSAGSQRSETEQEVTIIQEVTPTLVGKDQVFAVPEDQSSVSDQVWDGYQDPPYLSEPYSEQTADEDQLKKFLDFGDDYRAFISSHSDASSLSGRITKKFLPKSSRSISVSSHSQSSYGNQAPEYLHFDSDSDVEDLHHVLIAAKKALQFAYNILKNNVDLSNADYMELVATCQTHLRCLQDIRDHLNSEWDISNLSEEDMLQLQDLITQWESLQSHVLKLKQKDASASSNKDHSEIENIIASLKDKLNSLASIASRPSERFTSSEEVEGTVKDLQMSLLTLQEVKEAILEAKLQVHRLMSDAGLTSCYLKDDVTEMYQQWEDVYEQSGVQLTKLQALLSKWKQYGNLYQQTVGYVGRQRNKHVISTLLPETERKGAAVAELHLAELQQLVQELKGPLAEGRAWRAISQEVLQLEAELQKKCMDTSELAEHVKSKSPDCVTPTVVGTTGKEAQSIKKVKNAINQTSDVPSEKSPSRFWRVVRAALPFQLAVVLLYCLACLLEPHCCDNINNLNFSFWPQLRYVRGPPPI